MFVVVVDIVVVASYASHNKQLVSSGSDIRIGCSVLVAASKGFLYRRRNFEGFLCKWMGTSSEYGVAFAAFLLSIIYDCGLILFADLFQRASLFSDLLPFML